MKEPVEGNPVMDRLQAEVQDAKDAMLRVLPRQPRWRKRDLHRTIGGFSRCTGAVADLAVLTMATCTSTRTGSCGLRLTHCDATLPSTH